MLLTYFESQSLSREIFHCVYKQIFLGQAVGHVHEIMKQQHDEKSKKINSFGGGDDDDDNG